MAAPILNTNDLKLQTAPYRFTSTTVDITADAGAFKTPKNGAATIPTSITLTANPNNVFTAAATYKWSYALSTQPATWIDITGATSKTLTITRAAFLAIVGESTAVQYRCVVSETLLPTASGFFTVTYSKEVSEPIIVDMTRSTAVIPCSSTGVPTGFTNTDTTISVSRGGVALAYSSTTGVANSFTVSIVADNTARTVGTINTTATTYGISGITGITVDSATVVFIVTVYDASGTAVTPTFGKTITYNKLTNGLVGGDATFSYIDSSAAVIYKSTSGATIEGTHTNITVTGKRVIGSALPVQYGYLTVTGNGDTEATIAESSITTNINNTAGKTSYTVRLYNTNTVATATLLDTQVIPVLFTGASAITVVLSNDSAAIPTNAAGTAGVYTATPTDIHVYEGTTELTYDGVANLAGTWKTLTPLASSITAGSTSANGKYASISAASNIIADAAYVTYKISGKSLNNTGFTIDKTQTFNKAYKGDTGAAGATNIRLLELGSYQNDNIPANDAAYLKIDGILSNFPTVTTPPVVSKGHYLFVISPSTGTIDSSQEFDTVFGRGYGTDGTAAAVSAAVAALIAAINSVATGKIIALISRQVTSCPQNLRDVLITLGSGLTTTWAADKYSHIFIGMKGFSPGQGYEAIGSGTSVAPVGTRILSAGFTTTGILRQGAVGSPGVSGTKSITISAFKWDTATPTFSQAANYTWATGAISAIPPATGNGYPTGWTSSAPASTASGQTLYQINLTITALATDTVTAVNWSNAVSNTIGYRQDGTIGLTGNSARVCYIVTTSATPPATPTPGVGDAVPLPQIIPPDTTATAWSKTPTSTLTAGQFMYQSDGLLTTGGNIAWTAPYLSNLKVGSLSALSADLGVVKISTSGSLATGTKTYGSLTNGIFLGYDSTAYKFEIGPAGGVATGNGIKWDGTNLTINGGGTFNGTLNIKGTLTTATNSPYMQISNTKIIVSDGTVVRVKIGDLS